MRKLGCRWVILVPMMLAPFMRAEDLTDTNKNQYTLFNPTPPELMRHWYTDHAGQNPYTIDAGHFEGDLTALDYGYFHRSSSANGRTSQQYSIGETEVKAGLCNAVDLEVSIVPYIIYTDNLRGNPNRDFQRNGIGDLETRIKWNLWGNDGGCTAFAIGGVVDCPSGTGGVDEEQWEGGLIADFDAHLPLGLEMRIHSNVLSVVDDSANNLPRRRFSFQNEASLTHQIIGGLDGYCLFTTDAWTTPGRDWDGSIGAGLTYRIETNVELFAGMNFGVQGTPYDYAPFFGVSARF